MSGGSLVRRLVLLAAAWSLAVLAIAAVALSLFFSHSEKTRFDDELGETVDGLLTGVAVENGLIVPPVGVDPRSTRVYSGEYWEIATPDKAGGLHPLLRSRSLWDHALSPPPGGVTTLAAAQGKPVYYDAKGPLDQPLRVDALQARVTDYPDPVVFIAAEDSTPVNRDVRTFIATVAGAFGLLGLGLVLAVIVQVRVGLRPLFALRREVAEVRTGKAERLAGLYPSELAPLASELNALVEHNHQVVERQRTHVGNLAHALKTPLSVMLAEADSHHGPLAEVVDRQARIMSQQVDHHLRRARAAARTQGHGERTAVAPVVEELVRTLEMIFRDKALRIDADVQEGLMFAGERQDLLEIVGNVMENACKWGRSRVRIAATVAAAPGAFRLTVGDDGPGLPADRREAVLRRGERVDESAPGSGLGLSIVDELARAYGGGVRLGASSLGGLEVEITLPQAEV